MPLLIHHYATVFCQTPVLGLGLGVDFTFANKKKKNPHLNFLRKNGTMGMKFGTGFFWAKIFFNQCLHYS